MKAKSKNFIILNLIVFIIFTINHLFATELEKTESCISKIPIGVKARIFSLLPEKDFLKARQVCHEWNKSCQIAGTEKTIILINKKIGKEEGMMLVNLPFSILIMDNCILKYRSIIIISESNKYKKLDLNNTKIGEDGLRMISRNLTSLTSLSVNNDEISYFGIMGLVTENLTSLTSLSLNNDTLGDTSVARLFMGKNFPCLTSLSLRGNYITAEVGSLLIAENFPCLTSLDLSENPIRNDVKQKLKNKFPIEIKF